MANPARLARFEDTVLPHLDAAYNLARWLARNDHDAEDVVQEAMLRAFRFYDTFQGGEARHWLLKIVRNTFYSWYDKNKRHTHTETLGDEAMQMAGNEPTPEEVLIRERGAQAVREAMETLAVEFREVLLLREFEGCSYKEIADIMEVPIGTVMSRLSRARQQLKIRLSGNPAGVNV